MHVFEGRPEAGTQLWVNKRGGTNLRLSLLRCPREPPVFRRTQLEIHFLKCLVMRELSDLLKVVLSPKRTEYFALLFLNFEDQVFS